MRAKYDRKPKSLAGRFWRWHIIFVQVGKPISPPWRRKRKRSCGEKYSFKKYTIDYLFRIR